jgi:hypothetical protein
MKTIKFQILLTLAVLVSCIEALLVRAFGQPEFLALGNASPVGGTTIRADLNLKVEEAAQADDFFIGLKAMPPLAVSSKSGTYPKLQIGTGELLTAAATERSTDGSYGEITRQWTTDNYDCVDRGLEERVDDAQANDAARWFNLEATAARLTLRNIMLAHELRVSNAIMNATTYGAGTAPGVAYTEANIATISFVADVLAGIERCRNNGTNPDTIILSSTVYNRVRRATLVQNFVGGTVGKGSEVTASTLAQAFADEGIRQVLVGKARYNSAKKGQTASMTSIWPVTYTWVGRCNPGAMDARDGGSGFTMYWNAEGGTFVTESYRDDRRRSNMVRVRQNTAEKVVDATAGTLCTTTYS